MSTSNGHISTIYDVARSSGLSIATVSRALGDACGLVNHKTRKRVLDVAAELNYRPNWRAKALVTGRTHNIGVLYAPPMPTALQGVHESVFSSVAGVLNARGYHLMFVPLGADRSRWADILGDQRMDGCIIPSRVQPELAQLLRDRKMPVSLLNAESDLAVPQVHVDDEEGAALVTRHLLSLGHKRIVFIVNDAAHPHFSIHRRQAGYLRAMKEAGRAAYSQVITSSLEAFVQSLVSPGTPDAQRPTALISYHHHDAIRLLQLFWEHGLRVPEDLSLVTFNDVYPVDAVIPPLTTVALPTAEMGRLAAELLIERIEAAGRISGNRNYDKDATDEDPAKHILVLEEHLVVRRSTAAPAGHGEA